MTMEKQPIPNNWNIANLKFIDIIYYIGFPELEVDIYIHKTKKVQRKPSKK